MDKKTKVYRKSKSMCLLPLQLGLEQKSHEYLYKYLLIKNKTEVYSFNTTTLKD